MLWLILTILIAGAALIVAEPFLRRNDDRSHALSGVEVYRDQLAEVERDKEQGMIDGKEADLARLEIERRILGAESDEALPPAMAPVWHFRIAMGTVAIVVLGAVGLYAAIGRPGLPLAQNGPQIAMTQPADAAPPQPAHPMQASGTGEGAGDMDAMVKRLEQRMQSNPNDADGWRLLGWSYYNTGRYQESVDAYRHAVDLQKDDPAARALYGEAMVKAADGTVTQDALTTFAAVLAINPNDERARFFKGLANAQHGDNKAALDEWIALYNIAPAGADWAGDLRDRINELAQSSGIDVSSRLAGTKTATAAPPPPPGPSGEDIEGAKQLSPENRQQMVRTMVDGLASKLKASPKDADGWIMLIRSRMVLNQPEEARAALEQAKQIFADAPDSTTRITQAAQAMGVQPATP